MPNVLLITLDQWRGDCLSALGHPCVRTPNIDALAAEGVLFRRHYAQASPCGPSRASLLTGLYLHNHRSTRNGVPLDARHATLAMEARKAGLEPLLFGYTDTALDPRGRDPDDPALTTYEGVLPGFTEILPMPEQHWAWYDHLAALGYELPEGVRDVWLPPRPRDRLDAQAAFYEARHSETAFLTERVLPWLGRPPFFIHASYLRPHPPLIAPAPYNATVRPEDVPMPRRAPTREAERAAHPWLRAQLDHLYAGEMPVWDKLAMTRLDDDGVRLLRATYYGLVAQADAELGRLFVALKAAGVWDETLIVLTSDHGDQLGDHFLWGKDGWFEATFHVPLVVKAPAGARGAVVDDFTESVDVMPTILDYLGVPAPPALDGVSLRPFLEGRRPASWRDAAHFEYDFRDRHAPGVQAALGLDGEACGLAAIRDRRYKYVHFAALPPLFFDLARDPDELQNRAGDPEYRDLVLAYAQKMLSWRMQSEDRSLSHILLGPEGPRSRHLAGSG
jgi:arylsulfatase A-like enzyme